MYKSHDFVSDFLSLDDDFVEWNPDKVAPHVQEAYALITTCTKRQFADKVAILKTIMVTVKWQNQTLRNLANILWILMNFPSILVWTSIMQIMYSIIPNSFAYPSFSCRNVTIKIHVCKCHSIIQQSHINGILQGLKL